MADGEDMRMNINAAFEYMNNGLFCIDQLKNWFIFSVHRSNYGYTREVWRARKKRKSCSNHIVNHNKVSTNRFQI